MENKTNVYSKLAKARVILQNANLKKSGKNGYAGFKYFELSDFLPETNRIFEKVGLCSNFFIETVLSQENIPTGYIAHLVIIDSENNESKIDFYSYTAEATMKGATPIQMLGSQHTYLRRYLWLSAMEIVECDEQDCLSDEDKKVSKNIERKATESQLQILSETYKGDNLIKLLNANNISKLEDLSLKKASELIQKLQGVRN